MRRLIKEYGIEGLLIAGIILAAYLNAGRHLPEVIASAFQ